MPLDTQTVRATTGPTIVPCLWLPDQAKQAAERYVEIFPDSRITAVSHYPEDMDNPSGKEPGSVLTVGFELSGVPFTLLNGGGQFRPDPAISFFAHTDTVEEAERIAKRLADGGRYLMPLDAYPWSPRFAWVEDRFGVNWQVMASPDDRPRRPLVPCLMFTGDVHGKAEEALRHYVTIFPEASVEAIEHYAAGEGPEATIKHGRVDLGGQPLVALDNHMDEGTPFNEGVSLQVMCRDQDEVDHYWARLSEGGEEGPCGWVKDKYGVSWQVVPERFLGMIADADDADAARRAFETMLGMKKLDIALLEKAYEGEQAV